MSGNSQETHYDILGVDRGCSKADIKAAANEKMKEHRTDKVVDEYHTEMSQKIIAARRVLLDDDSRAKYDLSLDVYGDFDVDVDVDLEVDKRSRFFSVFAYYFVPDGVRFYTEDNKRCIYHNGKKVSDKESLEKYNNFINHPLTIITSFFGISNRLIDDADKQSFINILKNFMGWQSDASFLKKSLNTLFMPIVFLANLAFIPIRLAINLMKLSLVVLPRYLSKECESEIFFRGSDTKGIFAALLYVPLHMVYIFAVSLFYPAKCMEFLDGFIFSGDESEIKKISKRVLCLLSVFFNPAKGFATTFLLATHSIPIVLLASITVALAASVVYLCVPKVSKFFNYLQDLWFGHEKRECLDSGSGDGQRCGEAPCNEDSAQATNYESENNPLNFIYRDSKKSGADKEFREERPVDPERSNENREEKEHKMPGPDCVNNLSFGSS